MNWHLNETLRPDAPVYEDRRGDDLTPHLLRIVRRALRHPEDNSPLARAVRAAVAQAEPAGPARTGVDEELRARQVARRMSAVLAPRLSLPPGRAAHRETVCA